MFGLGKKKNIKKDMVEADPTNDSKKIFAMVESVLMNTQFAKASLTALLQVSDLLKRISQDSQDIPNINHDTPITLNISFEHILSNLDPVLVNNMETIRFLSNLHASLISTAETGDLLPCQSLQ